MRKNAWAVFAAALSLCLGSCDKKEAGQALYLDPQASIDQRVEDLLGRMTLEEKVDQMSMNGLAEISQSDRMFGVAESPFVAMDSVARASANAKQAARRNTRLGIPPIQIAECLHGVLAYGATIFPQAIAQGSTWNPDLIRQMGEDLGGQFHPQADVHPVGLGGDLQGGADRLHPLAAAAAHGDDALPAR